MDVAPISDQHPASDDQELAKVLAGVDEQASQLNDAADPAANAATPSGLQFEETPLTDQTAAPADDAAAAAPASDTSAVTDSTIAPVENEEPLPAPDPVPTPTVTAAADPVPAPALTGPGDSGLEGIKKDALEELRPLVTKLDLPADEKFDTMLLIIRSTDDKSLVQPAYDTAKQITDETKRAEALLDIIKEIDYFSAPGK